MEQRLGENRLGLYNSVTCEKSRAGLMKKHALLFSLAALSLSLTWAMATPVKTDLKLPVSKAPLKLTMAAKKEVLKVTDDLALAEKQVAEHPEDPEAHFLLGAAYSRSPYLDRAFQHIKTTKELLKANKNFEFIDRTLAQYETMLSNEPNNSILMYRMAMMYYLKAYSLEKYPHHYKNGPTGVSSDFYDKAKTTIQHVIALSPNDIYARNYYGVMVSENGKDLPRALEIWKESLAIDSHENAGAYLLLSRAYMQKGDIMKSLSYGARGLEIQQKYGVSLP
jgi:tetratricopeptide (TPR) repeat protein